MTSGDGCDDKCRVEQCGNGRIEDNEDCEDGNTANDDGCVACHFAFCGDFFRQKKPSPAPEQCDEGPTPDIHGACPVSCKNAYCGDGHVWNVEGGSEDCDDGTNALSGACPDCQTATCGDGYVWSGHEDCDGGPSPNPNGNCPSSCNDAYCGDGYVWNTQGGSEQCDLSSANSNTGACTLGCQDARCGDGFIYSGNEDCDTGSG